MEADHSLEEKGFLADLHSCGNSVALSMLACNITY